MTNGEVLNSIPLLTKDILYYWEAKGYVKPRKYQRGKVEKRDYSPENFLLISTMFKYYEKGFPPKKSYEKAIEEIRGKSLFNV
jgi:DNA-binding transcriptional MerR regulator